MYFIECLQSQLQKFCGDSAVVENTKIRRVKAEVMVRHGIGKTYQDETIKMLIQCDCFSMGFDESETNKTMILRISTASGIQLIRYDARDI